MARIGGLLFLGMAACGSINGDAPGSDASVTAQTVVDVGVGDNHTCAVLSSGSVHCWGFAGDQGQVLATGDPANRLSAANATAIPLPFDKAVQVSASDRHSCALSDEGQVACWGHGSWGLLGYGNTNDIGDDEPADAGGIVSLGAKATKILSGGTTFGVVSGIRTCALLETGRVRCWGAAAWGANGGGQIGDDEVPSQWPALAFSNMAVTDLAVGGSHTCVALTDRSARCFGSSNPTSFGNVGVIGDPDNVTRTADNALPLNVGMPVVGITAGVHHACAWSDMGEVRCWGQGAAGQLGYGNTDVIGDDETPAVSGSVAVGARVTQVVAGRDFTCALLESGDVRCWGDGNAGSLGYGNAQKIGDDESPASAGNVPLGTKVSKLFAGIGDHVCAITEAGKLRCWGQNDRGELGYGDLQNIGDDELPSQVGDVPLSLD